MSSDAGADAFFGGRTLFHLHTDWTDGAITFDEYFDFARAQRVTRLVFLEHIRRSPTYDPAHFAREVRSRSERTGVPAFVGFEAKVLDGGELDIDDAVAADASVVGIAEHGKALTVERFIDSFRRIVADYPRRFPRTRFVWVHPGLLLHRLGCLTERREEYRRLLHESQDAGVAIERNLRYELAPLDLLAEERTLRPVLGADAHAPSDLTRWLDAIERP